MFFVHTKCKSGIFQFIHFEERFQKVPFLVVFVGRFFQISVVGGPNPKNKVAFSILSSIVWTGSQCCYNLLSSLSAILIQDTM